jgi:hypothetical protein
MELDLGGPMDPRYGEIYERIYEARTSGQASDEFQASYARTTLSPQDFAVLRDAIDAAESEASELGWTLRSDAKALLAVNYQDLVLLPLREGGLLDPGLPFDPERAIHADILMLVRDATEGQDVLLSSVFPDESREISAHRVIDALSRNWDRLNVAQYRLWQ